MEKCVQSFSYLTFIFSIVLLLLSNEIYGQTCAIKIEITSTSECQNPLSNDAICTQLLIKNGTPPYSFYWGNSIDLYHYQVSEDKVNLIYPSSANWTVTVTDAENCMTSTGANSSAIKLAATIQPIAKNALGSIVLNVEGGIAPFIFTWLLPNGELKQTQHLDNLEEAGMYGLIIRDQNQTVTTAWYHLQKANSN